MIYYFHACSFFYLTNALPLIQKNNAYVFEVVGEEQLTGEVNFFFGSFDMYP